MHAFYSPKEEDFEAVKEGLKFAKIIEGEDGSFRAGYTLRVPGYKSERFLWMDEFFLCLRGKLRIAVSHPPSYQEKVFELNPGDVLFQGRGSRVRYEVIAKEPTLVFYVEIPSSEKGMRHEIFRSQETGSV